jgi:hypothetical protein
MNAVTLTLRKLYGLFVDDLGFALAIAGWIVVAILVLRLPEPAARGLLLFGGFALILIADLARAARR